MKRMFPAGLRGDKLANSEFEIGDIVWTISDCDNIEKIRIVSEKIIDSCVSEPYYKIHYEDLLGDSHQVKSKIFKTHAEAVNYRKHEKEKRRNEYREIINSKKDLLNFIISYMHSDGYTNYEAIDVAKEKCEELFNIEVDV